MSDTFIVFCMLYTGEVMPDYHHVQGFDAALNKAAHLQVDYRACGGFDHRACYMVAHEDDFKRCHGRKLKRRAKRKS